MKRRVISRIAFLMVALLLTGYLNAGYALAAGTLAISSTSGTPGSSVTIIGSGFTVGEGVTIMFDSTTVASGIIADAVGGWTRSVTIPSGASGATHTISASGSASGAAAPVSFTITPSISLSRNTGPSGTSVTIYGAGFAVSESNIVVTYDGSQVASGTSANSQGDWSTSFTVPVSAAGSHVVDAYGSTTSAGSVPDTSFSVTPTLLINPTSGAAGTSVTATGSSFVANESITITFDGTGVASISAGSTGAWTATFVVPASSAGVHIIDASGSTTSATAVPDQNFTVSAGISIKPVNGQIGTSVIVTGSGFIVNERDISVTYDGTPVASGISANAQGGWTATFVIPTSPAGPHTIDASGATTSAASVPDVSFRVSAIISLNRASGAPGSSVTVTGSGFAANEPGISLTYDGVSVASGISASLQGGWTGTLVVPPSASGAHIIDASGSVTPATAVPDISFTVSPTISVNRANGAPGASITVSGTGFGASEAGITVTFDGSAAASGISANNQGAWSSTFSVPAAASGAHIIDASGANSSAASVPDLAFSITPVISINRASGAPGSSVIVTGSGFGASEIGIIVTYDGNTITSGIAANPQGNWSATFVAPASAFGAHAIKARGSVTQAASVSDVGFNIAAGIAINPNSGSVGSAVDISGSGFTPNSPIKITYDDKDLPAQGLTADANGSFTKSITIPKSTGGNHTIRAVDSQNNDSRATFGMDTTPPAVPRPLTPADGDRIGILGDNRPTFKWSPVTDPSGVTYTLQIDTTSDFIQPLLDKTDISGTQYTLSASEVLPQGEYYWRIKAVDGASNQSAFTPPQLLKSGLMSLTALVLIIMLFLAAIGALLYVFVFRRLAAKKKAAVAVPAAPGLPPEVVPGQWRLVEPEETPAKEAARERALPWRLALPESTKTAKSFSTQDQARLKVIMDFGQSLPLITPDSNADWIVDLVENGTGMTLSAAAAEDLLSGQLQIHYEPAWMRHPLYQDLTTLLEGQAVLQDLNGFVSAVDRCASEGISILQDIYRDVQPEISPDFFQKGGWMFIATIYSDSIGWFLGKSLREPSDRDYAIKPVSAGATAIALWLTACANASPLIQVADENEARQLQSIHLKLRRAYRSNNKAREVMDMITQLEVERSGLLKVLSQLSRLKQ